MQSQIVEVKMDEELQQEIITMCNDQIQHIKDYRRGVITFDELDASAKHLGLRITNILMGNL